MTVVVAKRGKCLCHIYHVQTLLFSGWEIHVYRIHFCDWWNGLTSVALNPMNTTASYCHKFKVHWKKLLTLLTWAGEPPSPVCTFWAVCCHVKHHVQDSLLNTFEVDGLNQLISLNGVPTLKFCNTFWTITVVITSPPPPVW